MKRAYFIILFCCIGVTILAQENQIRKDTITIGHLIDTTFKSKNWYTEISFGLPGGAFGTIAERNFVFTLETNLRFGYYPINRLLIGWTLTPYITFSNLRVEGFRWSTGPFIRYYIPFYRVNKLKQLKSPFALHLFFEARVGQYNPVVLDAPYNSRVVGGFTSGIGFTFKLNKHLNLHFQFGPGYDFFSSVNQPKFNFMFSLGLNYSFPSKHDRQKKKLDKIISK